MEKMRATVFHGVNDIRFSLNEKSWEPKLDRAGADNNRLR